MSEGDFVEDNIDSKLYHSIPITSKSFRSLWALSTLFSKKKPKRMEKSFVPYKKKQVEKSHEVLERFETVEV